MKSLLRPNRRDMTQAVRFFGSAGLCAATPPISRSLLVSMNSLPRFLNISAHSELARLPLVMVSEPHLACQIYADQPKAAKKWMCRLRYFGRQLRQKELFSCLPSLLADAGRIIWDPIF